MLQKVTITGADDRTPVGSLIALSLEFPFVEWGILVSESQTGNYRFPSREWIAEFVAALTRPINVSTHICGKWVRQLLVGEIDWQELPPVVAMGQRVQINTHGQAHFSSMKMLNKFASVPHAWRMTEKEFIFQWDGVNDHLAFGADHWAKDQGGFTVSALYDTSAGAGEMPESWDPPVADFMCGYAGGISPENVKSVLNELTDEICLSRDYWIDMERRVRTIDDSRLDLSKVRDVLEQAAPYVLNTGRGPGRFEATA